MEERINKVVYTKGRDGLLDRWYLEKILPDGTCFLRKSKSPKWIDARRFAITNTVYPDHKAAKRATATKFISSAAPATSAE